MLILCNFRTMSARLPAEEEMELATHVRTINILHFLRLMSIYIFVAEECKNKGGTNSGSCAEGYGVCCTCK